jgi:chemotaxis protein histidine kinase CheA
MSIRLDPRRLAALKLLAAEAGLRPGELVTQWVEERLDAARRGEAAAAPATDGKVIAAINARIDELVKRLDALSSPSSPTADAANATALAPATTTAADARVATAPKRRGRPPKSASSAAAPTRKPRRSSAPRVPLHEEIAAIISEQGPMTAGQLATAVTARGRYTAPRTTKPLDAATISARVSNPVYRSRFVRREGKISLAGAE